MPHVASPAVVAARREREEQFAQDNSNSPDAWKHIHGVTTLSPAKQRRQSLAVMMLKLRSHDSLERRACELMSVVRTKVNAVKDAYEHGKLYQVITIGQALKRPAHSLRDTMLTIQPTAPLPQRASQFRDLSLAAQSPDANKGDEIRAWVDSLDTWLRGYEQLAPQ